MLANIDMLVIVASVFHPEVRWGLVDRFLVQAELGGLTAVVVLNKVDLLENPKLATPEFLERYNTRVRIYREIGYDVFEVCALKPRKTQDEVKRFRALVKGKLIGFAGHSGVGKSSLLNLMKPEFTRDVTQRPTTRSCS
jgi:ribosome biogenesis GTPase / thiamine phosphate phosphatase